MKLHVTPSQAKELTEEQFYSVIGDPVKRNDWANYHHKKVTIGKMIEFLFEKGHKITLDNCKPSSVQDWLTKKEYCQMELCDALWEVVKDVAKS
jgi:hypothetical protein